MSQPEYRKYRRLESDIREGEVLTPLVFKLTPEVQGYTCTAVDDRHPWYTEDSPFGGRIMPPLDAQFCAIRIRANYLYGGLVGAMFEIPAIVHYSFDAEYYDPAKVGETITITGKCTKKYEKRGRNYVDFEYELHGEDGRLISRYRNTDLLAFKKEGA